MGLIPLILAVVIGATVITPMVGWLLSINKSVGESNSKLESVTVSQSEWNRLQHMSLEELRANKETLATPYKVGDGFQVKVNLGNEGYFSNGKCGTIPSGKYANCFKDTTITVYNNDGDRLFSSRQLPLLTGLYTQEEIDGKLSKLEQQYKEAIQSLTTQMETNNESFKKEINQLIADSQKNNANLWSRTESFSDGCGDGTRRVLYSTTDGYTFSIGAIGLTYNNDSCRGSGGPGH